MPIISKSLDESSQETEALGFHLFGFLSGGFGLGEAARHTLRRILKKNIPVSVRDVDTHDHRFGQIEEFSSILEKRVNHWPGKINLFHLNPPEFEKLLYPQYPKTPFVNRLNVMVPFWELPILPPEWLPCLNAMDCILAPTRYIQEIIQNELPQKLVLHFPQSISVSEPARPDRRKFNLPDSAFVFLCAFDLMSDLERKNPSASIAAFKKAFPNNTDVRLVLKVNNAQIPEAQEKLIQAVGNDSRILTITEMLPLETLLTLYASCDALISLHRAEGLGLCMMEMMMQAKPTIVTAWSGNMDFTNSENSCLVDFSMIPVNSTHPAYEHAWGAQGLTWADANTDAAAEWMMKLASDPTLCDQIGQQARKTMIERAAFDSLILFDQIRDLHLQGQSLNKPQDTLLYFKKLQTDRRKLKRRQRYRRIEQWIKKIIRRTLPARQKANAA